MAQSKQEREQKARMKRLSKITVPGAFVSGSKEQSAATKKTGTKKAEAKKTSAK